MGTLKKIKMKAKHGGARKGAGAKPKYSEATITVAFRCPVSKVKELKSIVQKQLDKWKKPHIEMQGKT